MNACWIWDRGCEIDFAGWAGALANLLVVIVTVVLALRASREAGKLREAERTRSIDQAINILTLSIQLILLQLLPLRRADDGSAVNWRQIEDGSQTAISTLNLIRANEIPDAELMKIYNGVHVLAETVLRNARNLPTRADPVTSIADANGYFSPMALSLEQHDDRLQAVAARLGRSHPIRPKA